MNLKPKEVPSVPLGAAPAVDAQQMREIDRITRVDFDMEPVQLMENAGRMLATLARLMLGGKGKGQRVVVLAGAGNNGGGALCALRNLRGWGFDARLVLGAIETEMTREALHQLRVLRHAEVDDESAGLALSGGLERLLAGAEIVLDGLAGYGQQGPLSGPAAPLAEALAGCRTPVLSLDVPSGTQADGGQAANAVRAQASLMLGLAKKVLTADAARAWAGELYLADVGVPAAVYERAKLQLGGVFSEGPLVRLRR
jgi:NAD(P)H-hydrate epimerase